MIFVDTSVWYAAYVEEEPEHVQADQLLAAPGDRLVTTDYIVDELLTLLAARGYRDVAIATGRLLWSAAVSHIVWVERRDVEAGWRVFESFDDKTWSFTDCVSYAVMQRLQITEASALDEHFQQFGFAVIRP